MSALAPAPSMIRDAQALAMPVFGTDIAEDPCEILGDPWSAGDKTAAARHDGRPGIHPFARLTRRKH